MQLVGTGSVFKVDPTHIVVVAWHCSIQSFLQLVNGKIYRLSTEQEVIISKLKLVFYLTGNITIARHVTISIVSNVGCNLLVKRREGGDVGVRLFVNNRHLKLSLDSI